MISTENLGSIWFRVTDLSQDFHVEAICGPHYSRFKQALVSDGPTARGKVHLWIRFGHIRFGFGWVWLTIPSHVSL